MARWRKDADRSADAPGTVATSPLSQADAADAAALADAAAVEIALDTSGAGAEQTTPSTTSGETMSERVDDRRAEPGSEAAKGFCQDEHPHAPVVVPHSLNALVIEAQVIDALETVFDPEIPVNIYELGLIYDVKVSETGYVDITMTLTAPGCPAAQTLPVEVEQKVRDIPGVVDAKVEITFDPPWSMERMSDAARLQLGFM